MREKRLQRVLARLQNLPAIALPTDYPRPVGTSKVIEAIQTVELSEHASLSLLKLVLHDDAEEDQQELEQEKLEEKRLNKLRTMGVCPMGYHWAREGNGYRCEGGSHFVTDNELGL